MSGPFGRLRTAYAITLGNRLIPGTGVYGVGAVAPVMPNETSAQSWLDEFAEDLASLDRGPAGVVPVGDPWKFMRRAAGEGLAGIEGANRDAFPERFMFMVRVEEAGSMLPTVLASFSEDGWDSEMVAFAYVYKHRDRWYMVYNGNGFGASGIGYAVLI